MPIIIKKANINVPLKNYQQAYKVTYVEGNGDEQIIGDMSNNENNRTLSWNCTRRSLRYGIGNGNVLLQNDMGYFNSILAKATEIRIYADHVEDSPTNQIFKFKIDSIKHTLASDNNFLMTIVGRDFPQLADLYITKNFLTGAQANLAIQSIIDEFFSGVFTYTGIDTNMTGTIYGQYVDQPALTVIADILKQVNYDGRFELNNDLTTFPDTGQVNSVEKISYGQNMLPFDEFGIDYIDERNRVKVYGQAEEGLLIVSTGDDETLQNESWIKSIVESFGNLSTTSTVSQKQLTELNFLKTTPQLGTLTASNGLPTLKAGQSLQCSHQYAQISGYYNTTSIMDSFTQDGYWTTTVQVSRLDKNIQSEIKELNERITATSAQNINGMTDTVLALTFDDTSDFSSMGNLTVSDSKLKISSGSQGTATTNPISINGLSVIVKITLVSNATYLLPEVDNFTILVKSDQSFEVRSKNNTDCAVSYYQVSSDGGITYNNSSEQYSLTGSLNTEISFT